MRHIRLEGYRDEITGELGLIIQGTPKTDEILADREGGLIAHDLLEHQNGVKSIGCPRDELEALGGMWHVRGQHGDINPVSIWSAEETLAHEVARVAEELYNGNWVPGSIPFNTRPHIDDDNFDSIVELARKYMKAEATYGESMTAEEAEAFLTDAKHLLRIGCRKAERRFRHTFAGNTLFRAVKRAVGHAVRDLEYEGQLFRLSYGNGHAVAQEIYQ